MRRFLTTILILTGWLLAACATPTVTTIPGVANDIPPTATPTPQIIASPPSLPNTITIWIPPTFAPDLTTLAGTLLAERLTAFKQANPGISVSLRLKEESGPGGLLETLTAASNAAPAALPDVVALDPIALNSATLKDLLSPLDGLVAEPETPEWYDHALSTTRTNGGFLGLPFASEADVLAYRTDEYLTTPLTWSDILTMPAPFIFPAGDVSAAFTISQYLALDGPLYDEDGLPIPDPAILAEVLSFYSSAYTSEVIPLSARQYVSAAETWNALQAEEAASAVAPLSDFLANGGSDAIAAAPLPTRSEPGVCPTKTWSWAIVTRDPALQDLAGQLITWLTQPEFLGPWTYALGMLPPTTSALAQWPTGAHSALVYNLVTVAQPQPSAEVLATFGPPFHTAIEAVLDGIVTPSSAALDAVQAIQNP